MQRKIDYGIQWDIMQKECAGYTKKLNAIREEWLDSVSSSEKQKLSNKHKRYREYQEICVKSAIESRNRDEKSSIELEFASKFANCQYVSDLAARIWRDVGRSYSFNFYQKIVSGLYVTTANILDAMIGGIIDAVNIYINPYNRVRTDFRFFND